MAAPPHNLSFNHTSNSEQQQQQSLQTPDASTLLLHASKDNIPRLSTPSDRGFQSLEELLNDAGVVTTDTPSSSRESNKRSLDEPDFPIPNKKSKVEEPTCVEIQSGGGVGVSAGLPRPSNVVVPSILSSHSTANNHVPITDHQSNSVISSLPSTTGVNIPLVNPAIQSPAVSNNLTPAVNLIPSFQTSVATNNTALANVLGSQPPLALGSISLLVQLYKQFQTQGNIQGMQKIKDQLTLLQSQLISKSKNLTGQTGLTGTINITPPSISSMGNSNNSSFQPVLIPAAQSTVTSSSQLRNGPSIVTNGLMTNSKPLQLPTNSTPVSTPSIAATTTPLNSTSTSSSVSLLSSGTVPAIPKSTSHDASITTIFSQPVVTSASTSTTGVRGSGLPSSLPNSTVTGSTGFTNLITSSVLSIPAGGGSVVTTPTVSSSPSFVTHMAPTVSPQLPLGLQVTPQTQANVLKAVYSYRLQQIQEFLSALPSSQKPTTTQELRELLIKNNVLSKALPADFLTQLQKMSPQASPSPLSTDGSSVGTQQDTPVSTSPLVSLSTSSSIPVGTSQVSGSRNSVPPSSVPLPTTTSTTAKGLNVTSSSAHTVATPPILAPPITSATPIVSQSTVLPSTQSTVSPVVSDSATPPPTSSTSSQPNVSLPGVTLETLKTLCRLPEADFVRIPMPLMLTTIVQFLRANKWMGNSSELPGLLKQAQDILTKTAISTNATTTSTPTVVQATKISTPQLNNTKSKVGGDSSSSPLSQLMASFGMKSTPTVNHLTTTSVTAKPLTSSTGGSSSHTTPVTRQQSKAYQEQLEREKIASLQKILQSSEEARIAFRFKTHVDKLNQQLLAPDTKRPFTNWQDLILRLLPYHVYREPELPPGAMEKADAVYEGIAGVLLSRSQGLMSRYQQIVVNEQKESNEDRSVDMVLDRLWLEDERERKEEEEKQRREAEEIAAELSVVGGGMIMDDSVFDTDPFMLETDSYEDDSFLSQIWGEGFMDSGPLGTDSGMDIGLTNNDMNNTGIT